MLANCAKTLAVQYWWHQRRGLKTFRHRTDETSLDMHAPRYTTQNKHFQDIMNTVRLVAID